MSILNRTSFALGVTGLLIAAAAVAGGYGSPMSIKDAGKISPQDVADVFTAYATQQSALSDGFIKINDPVDNRTLELKLKDVYTKALLKSQPDVYVACANFVSRDGTPYDVDFYLKGTARTNLKVVDATIHAKGGRERYAWAQEKGLMRVKPISSEILVREEMGH